MSEIKQNNCLGRVLSCVNGTITLMDCHGDTVTGNHIGANIPADSMVTYVPCGEGIATQVKLLNVTETSITAINGNEVSLRPNAADAPIIVCKKSLVNGVPTCKDGMPMKCFTDAEGTVRQVHFMHVSDNKIIEYRVIDSKFAEGDSFHMEAPNNMSVVCVDLNLSELSFYMPIIDPYLRQYACALLNTRAGILVFGVVPQENNRVQGLWFNDEGRLNFMNHSIGLILKEFGQDIPSKCKVEFHALRGSAQRFIVVVHICRGDESRVYADPISGIKWMLNGAGNCVRL